MQLPSQSTPIARCETTSLYTQGALRQYPTIIETPPDVAARLASLADALENGTLTLLMSQDEYRKAVLALIPLRFGVKIIDFKADAVVRSVKRAADDAGKEISEAIFPNGMTPIIRPVGQTQVEALRGLEGRIAAVSRWSEWEANLARVVGVRTEYETALTQRKEAMIAAAAKRAVRNAAKGDFLDLFASIAGAVREVFPRDRKRQDVFFDVLRTARKAGAEIAEDFDQLEDDSDGGDAGE
jgi:hypothetical protein